MTKILDCTIRDGGHLNGWNYTDECVRASYFAAVKSGVDYFEVGYRFENPNPSWGKFAKCLDKELFNLFDADNACKLTVMIDAGKSNVNEFCNCKPDLTPIKAVRVATYPYELDLALLQCEQLKEKGYEVFLNLMVISEFKQEHFDILTKWEHKTILETISFADSFGSFLPDDITHYFGKLKEIGFNKIGFHSHNNLQLAFANSLKALENGAHLVDASIYGMGRGSGNLPIEIFTGYLQKKGDNKYNPVAYIDVVDRYYMHLMEKTPWGYRLQSLIGGLKNIHPYYVDELFEKKSFTVNEIWTAAGLIKKNAPISFNTKEMNNILSDKFVNYDDIKIKNNFVILPEKDAFIQGKIEFKNIFPQRNFLIIGNGVSIVEEKEKIEKFIKEKKCVVIGTNFLNRLYKPDFHCFINKKRFLNYINSVDKTSKLLLPSFFGKQIVKENTQNQAFYFDVELKNELDFNLFNDDLHYYKNLNVAISAIYSAYQMGAKEIFAVGIDGFGVNAEKIEYFYKADEVHQSKEELMKAYEEFSESLMIVNNFLENKSIPFSILTKTSHDKYYKQI